MAWRCKPQRTGSMPASELASLLVLVLMVDLLTSLDGFLGGLYNSIPPRQAQGAAPNLTLSKYVEDVVTLRGLGEFQAPDVPDRPEFLLRLPEDERPDRVRLEDAVQQVRRLAFAPDEVSLELRDLDRAFLDLDDQRQQRHRVRLGEIRVALHRPFLRWFPA